MFQVLASQCLTALCVSAGGGDGCTVAEQAEIDVLLDTLLSPCFSVRDAALRVSQIIIAVELTGVLQTAKVTTLDHFRCFLHRLQIFSVH